MNGVPGKKVPAHGPTCTIYRVPDMPLGHVHAPKKGLVPIKSQSFGIDYAYKVDWETWHKQLVAITADTDGTVTLVSPRATKLPELDPEPVCLRYRTGCSASSPKAPSDAAFGDVHYSDLP